MMDVSTVRHNAGATISKHVKITKDSSEKHLDKYPEHENMISASENCGTDFSLSKLNQAFNRALPGNIHTNDTSVRNNPGEGDSQYSGNFANRIENIVTPQDRSAKCIDPRSIGHHKRKKEVTNPHLRRRESDSVQNKGIHERRAANQINNKLNVQNHIQVQETRITSLRKLLHFSLNPEITTDDSENEQEDGNVLRSANSDAGSSKLQELKKDASQCLGSPIPPEQNTSQDKISMNKTGSGNLPRNQRQRVSKTGSNARKSVCHDEVKEKIAELARTPRIKTLDEILASLRIKIDSPIGSKGVSNCTRENSSFSENKRASAVCDHNGTCKNAYRSNVENHRKSNEFCGEIHRQSTKASHEQMGSTKRVKVILSGEVSRKPKTSYSGTSTFSSSQSHVSHDAAAFQHQVNCRKQIEDEEIKNSKLLQKKQRELARKKQANNTKELKEILHARTSYRKVIPGYHHNTCAPNTLEIPCKKPKCETGLSKFSSPQELSGYQHAGRSQSRESTVEEGASYSNVSNEEAEQKNALNNAAFSVDCKSIVSSREKSIDDEVKEILKRLPPLKEDDFCWSESQDYTQTVKSSDDVDHLINKMYVEHIEGINGNINLDSDNCSFREWNETVVRPTYGGSLTLLPYVIID